MRVPATAPPEIQEALREIWRALDRWEGSRMIDLKGRRIGNAGQAIEALDYVTRADLDDALGRLGVSDSATFARLVVTGQVTFKRALSLSWIEDAAVLYTMAGGVVVGNAPALSFRYSNGRLRVAETGGWEINNRLKISATADGVALLTDNAATGFGRLMFGGSSSAFPAWKRNAAAFNAVLADDSGRANVNVADLDASGNVDADTFSRNGVPGVDFGPAAPASLTITKGIVTAAS